MGSLRPGQVFAIGVAAVAAFTTLSAISFPVPDRKPGLPLVLLWLGLLVSHAAIYWFGGYLRDRFGLRAYVGAQAALVFAIGASGNLFPVSLGLLIAFTADVIILAGKQWGTIPITFGAIAIYVINSLIAQDLYRAATAGLILTITGVIGHAIAALMRREPVLLARAPVEPAVASNGADLTPRESDVLRKLVSGARSSQIATELSITERTVKSHLASIYQKLRVESRAGAVAVAVQRKLV
jgi:DNA-binding CsgD family transcriptional regulator